MTNKFFHTAFLGLLFMSIPYDAYAQKDCPGKSITISDLQEVPASWTDCVGSAELPKFKYVGEWKDALPHGQGTTNFPNGDSYVGELEKDIKNGQGVYTFSNGIYSGEWKDDQRSGQGTFTFSNGGSYVGEWKDSKYHGQGTMEYLDGSIYVGEWKDASRHGQGTLTWASGASYVGEWKDDKRHGQSTYTYRDGGIYVGEWKDDLQHGKGVYKDPDGTTFLMEASNGEFIKKEKVNAEEDAKKEKLNAELDAWLKKHYYTRTVKKPRVLAHRADGTIYFDIGDDTFRGLKVRVECYDAFDTKTVSDVYNLSANAVEKHIRGFFDAGIGSDATYGGKLIGGPPLVSSYYSVALKELAASPSTDYCGMTTLDFRQ